MQNWDCGCKAQLNTRYPNSDYITLECSIARCYSFSIQLALIDL